MRKLYVKDAKESRKLLPSDFSEIVVCDPLAKVPKSDRCHFSNVTSFWRREIFEYQNLRAVGLFFKKKPGNQTFINLNSIAEYSKDPRGLINVRTNALHNWFNYRTANK